MMNRPNKARVEAIISDLLTELNFDYKNDPNMKDTPSRVAKMYCQEIISGCYDPPPELTVFPNTEKYDELIIVDTINFHSMCSHHMLTFYGKVDIGILPGPDTMLLGLSKYSRIVEWFAKRPQIQEGMTQEITNYIEKLLKPRGLAVRVKAKHLCAIARGVQQTESNMTTISLRGELRTNASIKDEFLRSVS